MFGWLGVIVIVLAYALLSFSLLKSTDFLYQLLNGLGALGIVLEAIYKKDYQPAVLNIIWLIIALVAILRIL